jgi:Ca-activated chloride channel family protein
MTLGNPWALALIAPVALVAYLLARSARLAEERRTKLATMSLLRRQAAAGEPWRAPTRLWLYGLAACLVVVALARPQGGSEGSEVAGVGADILLIIDVSNSMAVRDVEPTRFAQAMYAAAAVLDRVSPLDRVGLAAFADEGQLECPLTTDLDVLLDRLTQLDTGGIGEGSSDLYQAIDLAAEQFPQPAEPGLAIIISDGEDLLKQVDNATVDRLAQTGVVAVTIGVGTQRGGRVPNPIGGGRSFGDLIWRGQPVTSSLEEGTLRQIADATGGEYLRLADLGTDEAVEAALSHRDGVGRDADNVLRRRDRVPREWFQVPLGLAIILLLADAVVASMPPRWVPDLRGRRGRSGPFLVRRD